MSRYSQPATLAEALAAMRRGKPLVLAGATDLYPADTGAQMFGTPRLDDAANHIVDLSHVDELRGISHDDGHTIIGAMTTWSALRDAALPPWFAALEQAAREVGGMQIQNRGTLGGNLCNASPAADGVPPLLALDAMVRIVGPRGERRLPLGEFITGPRRTALEPDELLCAILVPDPAEARHSVSSFVKLGAREHLVISIAMVAARLDLQAGRISGAAVAVGACSATALRLGALERRLLDLTPAQAADAVQHDDLAALSPITDVRASGSYRRHAAVALIARALAACAQALPATAEA